MFKTRKMVADEYTIHVKTLMRKLERAGIELPPGDISPKDQCRIYDHFGLPPGVSYPVLSLALIV